MKRISIVTVLFAVLLFNAAAQSFDTILFRASVGAGGTIVDFYEALGWEDQYLEEWDSLHVQGRIQVLPMQMPGFRIGAAVSYERLFYYYYRIPYTTPLHYEGTVGPWSVLAIGSFDSGGNLFTEAGAGIYIFGDGVALGVEGRQGYKIRLREDISIPISIHAALIFGESIYIPIGLSGGIEYRYRRQ